VVCVVGFIATVAAYALRTDGPPIAQSTTLVAYAGILLMPIAIGVAVLRYRLYEIDRIISRTIGWALVTGVLVAVFAGTVVGLQAILTGFTQGQTLAVAASTLIAFVLFQPVRRRVQSVVDRRFNRARYDAEGTAAAFAERQRDQVDIAGLKVDLTGTIDSALHPRALGVWIRHSGSGGTP
jgi:divalent metal cation (Fe/Co/Zn/Cd) transporter